MLKNRITFFFRGFENYFTFFVVLLLALFPVLEVVARKFFRTGVPNSTNYIHHLVLILTFVGGMITSREKQHLSLALNFKFSERTASAVQVVNAFISSMFAIAFAWTSLSFIFTALTGEQRVGIFSLRLIAFIMVLGYTVMAVRFIFHLPAEGLRRKIAALGLVAGTLLAAKPVINVLSTLFTEQPKVFESILSGYDSIISVFSLPLILTLIVCAFLGTPIFIVLGGIALLLFANAKEPMEVIANEAYEMLINHSIPAIPLFTVAGFLLSESKAGERLVNLFRSLFGWFPGGIAVASVLVCAFFTTFTGASGVTILALGGLLYIILTKAKYKRKFSIGLLTASGSIGLLFAPSLPIIIYGVVAQISIKDMFIGGIIPGLLMILVMMIVGIVYAFRNKVTREPFKVREVLLSLKGAIWEILIPFIIIAAYFGGLTTLVESGAVAVLYILIVEVFIHRDIKIRDLRSILLKCVPIIGGVLTILALAKGLSYFIVDVQLPQQLTEWAAENISSPIVFLLILNVGLLITGCFMDIFSAILVVVPLIIPLGNHFGIHPVHLGIIFLANMELGYLTPPIGLNLFLASYRFEEPMPRVYKNILLFFIIQLAAVLLITYIPFFSTWLLSL